MSKENVKDSIKKIVVEVLNLEIPVSELFEDSLIEAYGVNSVDALEILIHVENAFDIEIDEDDLNAELINSISNLEAYVSKKIDEKLESSIEDNKTISIEEGMLNENS